MIFISKYKAYEEYKKYFDTLNIDYKEYEEKLKKFAEALGI